MKTKYVLFEYMESEDNYYGGSEYTHLYNYLIKEEDSIIELDENEFEKLKIGLNNHNSTNVTKVGIIKLIKPDQPFNKNVSITSLMEFGEKELKVIESKRSANKRRAEKARKTRELNKIKKAAKDLGLSIDELLKAKPELKEKYDELVEEA